jgi:hypothetical protein
MTTTLNICGHFTCPEGWVKKANAESLVCYSWGCTPSYCCEAPTTTPLTTTVAHCSTFTCPPDWVKKPNPQPCWKWGCTPSWCCIHPTTTPALSCASVTCVGEGWSKNAAAASQMCTSSAESDECQKLCCVCSTQTPTLPPAGLKLYSGKQPAADMSNTAHAHTEKAAHAWFAPILGAATIAALVTSVLVHRTIRNRRAQRECCVRYQELTLREESLE